MENNGFSLIDWRLRLIVYSFRVVSVYSQIVDHVGVKPRIGSVRIHESGDDAVVIVETSPD